MAVKHTSSFVYVLVWLGLLALTLLSFLLSRADLGAMDTVLSLLIAAVKSVLVGLFFMHLIEERLRTAFVPILSTGFVILLISLVVTDVLTRHTFPKAPSPVVVPEDIGGQGRAMTVYSPPCSDPSGCPGQRPSR